MCSPSIRPLNGTSISLPRTGNMTKSETASPCTVPFLICVSMSFICTVPVSDPPLWCSERLNSTFCDWTETIACHWPVRSTANARNIKTPIM